MALLEEIDYSPGGDLNQQVFDKLNQLIQTVNSILGGKSENDGIRKSSANDFDFEIFKTGGINWFVVPIGAWNMDTTESVSIPYSFSIDSDKIVFCSAMIRSDSAAITLPINTSNSDNTLAGKIVMDNSNARFDISRTPSGLFDNNNQYDNTGFNRGYIILAVLK